MKGIVAVSGIVLGLVALPILYGFVGINLIVVRCNRKRLGYLIQDAKYNFEVNSYHSYWNLFIEQLEKTGIGYKIKQHPLREDLKYIWIDKRILLKYLPIDFQTELTLKGII